MRCTNCGLPLSPTNTSGNCPRCHTSVGSSQQQVMQGPFSPAATPQSPFSPSVQTWEPTSTPTPSLTPPMTPTPIPGMYSSIPQGYSTPQPLTMEQQYLMHAQSQSFPMPPTSTKNTRTGLFGYFIATVCVVTGGLLLVFVYFMGLALPTGGTLSINTTSPIVTQAVRSSPTTALPSPTTIPSATSSTNSAFPGQQYIANPQMAGAVDTMTDQPTQLTTTFTVNQKIYVTFDIHPQGKTGAVCLSWFLNNHPVTHYAFAAGNSANSGYSYAIYGGTGKGYVQIAWANSTTCINALLAQQVNFTVVN
jgi:hypothetical protein